MVSNARLDLPEPERPVTTMSRSRGISSEMFLRLCTRAPCTAIVVRAEAFAPFRFPVFLEAISRLRNREERQLLHLDVALLGQMRRRRRLPDEPLVREILARRQNAFQVEV